MAASRHYLHAVAEEFIDGRTQFPWAELNQMSLEPESLELKPQFGEPAVAIVTKFSRRPDQSIDVQVIVSEVGDPGNNLVFRSNVAP